MKLLNFIMILCLYKYFIKDLPFFLLNLFYITTLLITLLQWSLFYPLIY